MPQGGTRVAQVDFHVDAASDVTVLGRSVFTDEMRLTRGDTEPGLPSTGIGGSVESRIFPGYLIFDHVDGRRTPVHLWFTVALDAPTSDVSLLGLDVLLAGRFNLDRQTVEFEIDG